MHKGFTLAEALFYGIVIIVLAGVLATAHARGQVASNKMTEVSSCIGSV
jgi:hypothetical protein